MFKKLDSILLSFVISSLVWCSSGIKTKSKIDSRCIVNISENKRISGLFSVSDNGVEFCAYLGIPYAKPPINELRFEPPQPLTVNEEKACNRITLYTKIANKCLQASPQNDSNGSEDCLYLNVYVKRKARNFMPVVVWIHGGSYNFGSSTTEMDEIKGPEMFLEKEIIFVSMNYRLGVAGFLHLPELNITGNYGLMDQQLALKWTNQNINNFNGDSTNITLMGWSSGSASTAFHLFFDATKHLFNKVILISGSILNPWAYYENSEYCNQQLKDFLRIKYNVDIDSLKNKVELKKIDSTYFVDELFDFNLIGLPNYCFIPTKDDDLIKENPMTLLEKSSLENISIMIGYTAHEMEEAVGYNSDYNYSQFDIYFENDQRDEEAKQKFMKLKKFIDNEFLNESSKYNLTDNDNFEIQHLYTKFISDMDLKFGVKNFIKMLLGKKKNDVNLFMYMFSYDGNYNYFGLESKQFKGNGPIHGDDLGYLFKNEFNIQHKNTDDQLKNNKNEMVMQWTMIEMWCNFIKHGNPTPKPLGASSIKPDVLWENYKYSGKLLNIDSEMEMIPDDDDAYYKLWDLIMSCLEKSNCDFLDIFKK